MSIKPKIFMNVVLLTITTLTIATGQNDFQNVSSPLKLKSTTSTPHQDPLREISNDFVQVFIEEENPDYDGVVLVNKKDYSLQFTLVDKNQKVVWQKPVESNWIIMSPTEPVVAVAGKTTNTGRLDPDVPLPYSGITVYNKAGNRIYSNTECGVIREMKFSKQTDLLAVCEKGVLVFDKKGEVKYSNAIYPDEIKFTDGDQNFFDCMIYDREKMYKMMLVDIHNPSQTKEWNSHSYDVQVLYADKNANKVIVTKFRGEEEPVKWNMIVYDFATWQPFSQINDLEAGAFAVNYSAADDRISFVMARPSVKTYKNPGEILFGELSLRNHSFSTTSLGYPNIVFSTDKVNINPTPSGYKIDIGKSQFELNQN